MKKLSLIMCVAIFYLTSCDRGQSDTGNTTSASGPSTSGLQRADSIRTVGSGTGSTGTNPLQAVDTVAKIKAPVYSVTDTPKKLTP